MKKLLLASAATLAIVTGSAFAADVIAPEPAPVPDWTAFHIGVGGGGGWNLYNADSSFCADEGSDCEDGDFDGADLLMDINGDDLGAFYGLLTVEAGFDYQFTDTPFVIGILANYDFNGSNSADAEANSEEDDGDFTHSSIKAELDDTWFLGGRMGFATMNNASLLYVLGGYTWADGKLKAEHAFQIEDGDFDDLFEFDDKDTVDGWTIGGGVETMLSESLSLKVEYRHDFLGDMDFDNECGTNDEDGEPDCEELGKGSVDFGRDTVRAVLSWRFGGLWE